MWTHTCCPEQCIHSLAGRRGGVRILIARLNNMDPPPRLMSESPCFSNYFYIPFIWASQLAGRKNKQTNKKGHSARFFPLDGWANSAGWPWVGGGSQVLVCRITGSDHTMPSILPALSWMLWFWLSYEAAAVGWRGSMFESRILSASRFLLVFNPSTAGLLICKV